MKKNIPKDFLFLGDLIELKNNKSIRLLDGVILRRAKRHEIKIIDEYIKNFFNSVNYYNRYNTFTDGHFLHHYDKDLYSVIEINDFQRINTLKYSLSLSETDIYILFEAKYINPIINKTPGVYINSYIVNNYLLDNADNYDVKKIGDEESIEIKNIYNKLCSFERHEFPTIFKAIEDFYHLGEISKLSPFYVVAVFSLIENLIVNYDKQSDNTITRQLKSKLNLINNRLEKQVDIFNYFKGPTSLSFEIIIEKIYKYRSLIAHGNNVDFENDLQIINSEYHVIAFIHELLKKVILFALTDPQLIMDLKKC